MIAKHGISAALLLGTLTTAGIAWLMHSEHGIMLSVVVAIALVANHFLACVSGAAIPFVMRRLGFDPAQSATIFATTVTDVGGFFTLLGLAYLLIPGLR